MGSITDGFLARIFRLRRLGHHSLFASPWVGCTRPWTTGQPSALAPPVLSAASGVCGSVVTGSWFSAMGILPDYSDGCSGTFSCESGTSGGTVRAQAPVGDVGFVDREALVVGRGQAGCLTDRAVDVRDDAARPAHDVVVIIPDPPLEARRAAGRLDPADEPCLGERVQDVVDGLQGDVADTAAHPGGDRLDAEVVAVPDGLEQCDAGGCHPQAGPAQFRGGARSEIGRAHV